ncbi:MAG: cupin domain-containing protein [Pseudomonadota bacterium]
MKNRRVVTGIDANGKAIILSDGAAPRATDFKSFPGFSTTLVWSTAPVPTVGIGAVPDPTPETASFHPEPGETRLMIVTFPPDAAMAAPTFDPVGYGTEIVEANPGLAARFEPDHPGMHTTDTVDYDVVLEGDIWLELDDGRELEMHAQDVVIQNGTRHAWRNKSNKPATMLFVFVGAQRRA